MNISIDYGGLAQLDAPRGIDIAFDEAEDDDIAHIEVCRYAGVGADGEAAAGEGDSALKFTIQKQIFAAGELSADADGLANVGGTFNWGHETFLSCSARTDALTSHLMKRTIPIALRGGKLDDFERT